MRGSRWWASSVLIASFAAIAGSIASGVSAGHSPGAPSGRSEAGGTGHAGGSTGTPGGTAVSHVVIAGEPATVAHLPPHAPFSDAQLRKLHRAGYYARKQDQVTYWCRRVRWTGEGWMNDCFD